MKISNLIFIRALLLWSLVLRLAVAQDDRGERIQESVSSSDDRINFTRSKAAPSKIESIFFQDFLKKRDKCKREHEKLAQLEIKAKRSADKAGRVTLFAKDKQAITTQQARVEKAEAAVKEAARRANSE
jgi:hypothetical protein